MDGIIFAHSYATASAAKQQFNDYTLWAARELPTDTACWRTRTIDGEKHLLVVVDESEASRALSDFTWKGERYLLPLDMALGFVRRRLTLIAERAAAGERGRVAELTHFAAGEEPILRADGSWELP